MVQFIDARRDQYGVEPICAQLQIAPSTYYETKTRQVDPARLPKRARREPHFAEKFCASTTPTSASTVPARSRVSLAASVVVTRCTVERLIGGLVLQNTGRPEGRSSRVTGLQRTPINTRRDLHPSP